LSGLTGSPPGDCAVHAGNGLHGLEYRYSVRGGMYSAAVSK
jgi:hypothetical protein